MIESGDRERSGSQGSGWTKGVNRCDQGTGGILNESALRRRNKP